MKRAFVLLLLAGGAAWARPPKSDAAEQPPMRVTLRIKGVWTSNCAFSDVEIPPMAPATTPVKRQFHAGEAMWARCFLPARAGSNKPGDLVDHFYLDGKPWWTQAYDHALPSEAVERPLVLGEVLRTPLATVKPGGHQVLVIGTLKRGGRDVPLYRGEFLYVR